MKPTHEIYKKMVDTSINWIYMKDNAGSIIYCSDICENITGYSPEEFINQDGLIDNIVYAEDKDKWKRHSHVNNDKDNVLPIEFRIVAKNGDIKWISHVSHEIKGEDGSLLGVRGSCSNITKRKLVEKELEESRDMLRVVADFSHDWDYWLNPQGKFEYISPSCKRVTGYDQEDFYRTKGLTKSIMHPEDRHLIDGNMEESRHEILDYRIIHRSGVIKSISSVISPVYSESGRFLGIRASCRDVTEQKKIELELKKKEEWFQETQTIARIGNWDWDIVNDTIFWSDQFYHLLGLDPKKDAASAGLLQECIHEDDKKFIKDLLKNGFAGKAYQKTLRFVGIGGSKKGWLNIRSEVEVTEDGKPIRMYGTMQDITESKLADEALKESEQRFADIINFLPDATLAIDNKGKVLVWNRAAEEMTGVPAEEMIGKGDYEYSLPLYGERRPILIDLIFDSEKEINKYYSGVEKSGNILIGEAYSELLNDNKGAHLWGKATPLFDIHGNLVGAIESMRDITQEKKADASAQDSMEKLEKTVEGIIHAMEKTIEVRDPYTAGHQRRVSELAVAIAEEMGWTEKQVEGIRIAATIHDIGKIYIPAEILSKPGRISENEFNIIKMHPEVSYSILESVEFPWPIADIVAQHHEKIDGSGYPAGLKNDDILIEAKIISVADVVEAMASHRPYRPALGVELALEEIQDKKGTAFDNAVVDACLTLFKEKNWQFKT